MPLAGPSNAEFLHDYGTNIIDIIHLRVSKHITSKPNHAHAEYYRSYFLFKHIEARSLPRTTWLRSPYSPLRTEESVIRIELWTAQTSPLHSSFTGPKAPSFQFLASTALFRRIVNRTPSSSFTRRRRQQHRLKRTAPAYVCKARLRAWIRQILGFGLPLGAGSYVRRADVAACGLRKRNNTWVGPVISGACEISIYLTSY